MAVAGVAMAVTCAWKLDLVSTPVILYGIGLLIAVYNLGFRILLYVSQERAGPSGHEQRIFLQLVFDLAALTLLLHWSGSLENPFAMFFAFHAAIAAIAIPGRPAILIGVVAVLLFGGTVVAERSGLLQHYSLVSPEFAPDFGQDHSWPLVVGYMAAFVMMLFGVIYFVETVDAQRRRAEDLARKREWIALARDRMARIGEISSGVAHTVRNPLHGVMNCLQMLREQSTDVGPDTEELLELMSEGLRRIGMVTSRLLVLTRDETLHKSMADVREVIHESLAFVGDQGRGSRPRVKLELFDTPEVEIDRNRLSEALINLLENASHATRDGGTVTVRTALVREAGEDAISIEVEDEGGGIPEENLEHIFDPFFTTKTVGEGSGLGLSIVRKIVEAHDGRMIVESKVGEGSRFTIVLPLRLEGSGSKSK